MPSWASPADAAASSAVAAQAAMASAKRCVEPEADRLHRLLREREVEPVANLEAVRLRSLSSASASGDEGQRLRSLLGDAAQQTAASGRDGPERRRLQEMAASLPPADDQDSLQDEVASGDVREGKAPVAGIELAGQQGVLPEESEWVMPPSQNTEEARADADFVLVH